MALDSFVGIADVLHEKLEQFDGRFEDSVSRRVLLVELELVGMFVDSFVGCVLVVELESFEGMFVNPSTRSVQEYCGEGLPSAETVMTSPARNSSWTG